ncbi:metal ABC transporter permease [cyanobiont of Ornithocercus magnificus]|nr:metal ABC transporter permease [cyanobiont of Ornithocercus magnificus]
MAELAPWWTLPLLMALLVGMVCPATGTLLLTQQRLLQANLLSHAVLPGIVLALGLGFDPTLGGVISGVGGALLAEHLTRGGEVNSDAVINTALAGFLGFGVLLIPLFGLRLNLEAALFGDLLSVNSTDLLRTLLAAAALLLLLARHYREMVYLGVDPEGASAAGLPVMALRFALTLVTAVVVVGAMVAVGITLVIALLCAPVLPGLSHSSSLGDAIWRSAALGSAMSAIGFALAVLINLPPGPLIGVLALVLLLVGRCR